jgi:tetratricopeptide (TPR) repeat protein
LDEEAFAPALDELEQVVAKEPENAQALFYLGVTHQALEQYAKAAAAYEGALGIEKDLIEARWNLALAYVALYRYQKAAEQFRAYLDMAPDGERAAQARAWLKELEP